MTDRESFGSIHPRRQTIRQEAQALVRDQSRLRLLQLVGEYYELPPNSFLHGRSDRAKPYVASKEGPKHSAKMKIYFAGDVHAQSLSGSGHASGSALIDKIILNAHHTTDIRPESGFTSLNSLADNNSPYQQMRRLRRNRNGTVFNPGSYGINYAASALVGNIVLFDPPLTFSIELPDEDQRELLKRVFVIK